MLVRVPTNVAASLPAFEGDLREELNVKAIRWLETGATFIDYRFKPNLRVVGKKYGKLVPALTEALKALDNDSARAHAIAVENGQSFELVVDGQTLTIAPDEVLVETSSPDGYAVAEENGVLAALDTTHTPANDTNAVNHGGVRIGTYQGVRVINAFTMVHAAR